MRAITAVLAASLAMPACFLVHTSDDAGGADAGAADGGARDAGPLDCEPVPGVRVQDGIVDPVRCRCPEGESQFWVPGIRDLSVVVCDGVPDTLEYTGCNSESCAGAAVCIDNVGGGALGCVEARACLYAYVLFDLERPPWACTYADFTSAETGVIPEVECTAEMTRRGLCARGCPCPEGEMCYGHSESHPIGACVPAGFVGDVCSPDEGRGCGDPDETCLFPVELPPWMASMPPESQGRFRVRASRCIPPARCAALQAAQPGVWSCLDIAP